MGTETQSVISGRIAEVTAIRIVIRLVPISVEKALSDRRVNC